MLPSQAGAGNGAAAALARGSGLGRSPVPRGANGGGAAAGAPGGCLKRETLYSGSEGDSESAEEEELGGERRGVKRGLAEAAAAAAGPAAGAAAAAAYSGGGGGGAVSGAKPGKKTRGRVKIKMEFIDNKLRRYTTFSKRKTGIMKKVRPRDSGRGGGAARLGPAGRGWRPAPTCRCEPRPGPSAGQAGGPCPETAAASPSRGRTRGGRPGPARHQPLPGGCAGAPGRAAGAGLGTEPPGTGACRPAGRSPGVRCARGGPSRCGVQPRAGADRCSRSRELPPKQRVFGGTAGLPRPHRGAR